jgi:hypothetical protein
VYDVGDPDTLYSWLTPGNVYDLGARAFYQRNDVQGSTHPGG